MRKRLISLALALALCLGLAVPAMAAGYAWPIEQVAGGGLVVTTGHSLYTWGSYSDENFFGAKGNFSSSLWPNGEYCRVTKVMDDIQAVATGKEGCINGWSATSPHPSNIMFLKTDGSVWMWGDNCVGQLGQGYTEDASARSDFSPVKVMDGAKAIDCGGNLCAAITTDGDLYCWGYVLGYPDTSWDARKMEFHYLSTPTKVLSDVTAVACGNTHTVALTADGGVYTMGDHSKGLLGDGTNKGAPVPEMARIMDGCTAIAAGRNCTLALKADGTVYACGMNMQSMFGVSYDDAPYYLTPTPIISGVKQMFAGSENLAFIKTDNSLWITGGNMFGIHGQGEVEYEGHDKMYYPRGPVQVDTDVKTAYISGYAMLYVKNDGLMYGTGSSVEGVPRYTYQDTTDVFGVSTSEYDGIAAVCSPTLAGTSRTPYTGPWPSASTAPAQPKGPAANPTSSKVLVNGKEVAFDAYTIDGSNYFKLRDLAFVLNGTEKQFEVGWDNASKTITLTSGQGYTANGSEMAKGSGAQSASVSASKLLIDGKEVSLTAYTIGGNNYFKLRDIGQAFDFGIGWDNATKTITIDTSTGYTA